MRRGCRRTVLVLGAGFTGQAVIRLLVGRRDRVMATARSVEGARNLDALGAEGHVWQSGDPLPHATPDAAIVLFPPRGVDSETLTESLRGIPRLVYCSSTSVYGDQGGGDVTEETPVAPDSPWSIARVQAETALGRLGAMIVRAAGIYGLERNVLLRHRDGLLRNAGDTQRPVNLIHVDDLAAILVACLDVGVPGRIYLAATGVPVPWKALAELAVERTGRPLPPHEPVPADPNVAMFYRESKRCRPTRLGELAVTLRYADTLGTLRAMPFEPRFV